jgi:predicted ATPase/DNA-binding SARP family transcriptional activator
MPSSRSATAQPRRVEPLPEPLTPLLGRAGAIDETLPLLDSARLVTLTGAGGSGKTRLALELAHRVADAVGRAVWVELAPLSDGELIAQQIANALLIRPAGAREPLEESIDVFRERATLLVLDNCEHLIDDCAVIAERILRSCPDTTILATSREPLGVAGETTWLVPPLANPDAVQLFAERARAVLPVFALEAHNTHAVEIICARLDGIPLAIELAAARVKVLAVWQIAERLNDAFRILSSGSRTLPRHRTIRETIDWSFRLLCGEEQILFRRLAVFHCDFALEAAETICADDLLPADAVLDLLSALVDKSLVVCDRTAAKARYRLLETVRQFAAEKVAVAREFERFREAHARYFFALAEAAEPLLFAGASDPATMIRIDDEIANIRAVFEWAEEDPSRAEKELRLVYALDWYWFARGQFDEARRRINTALARSAGVDVKVRAHALIAAANAAVWQADWSSLHPIVDEAAAVLGNDENLRVRAMARMLLAIAQAFGDGDELASQRTFADALVAARAHGGVVVSMNLHWIGAAALLRGDYPTARAAFEEGAQIGIAINNKPAIGHPSALLGFVCIRQERYDEAITVFRRALDVFVEIDDRWGLTHVIEGVALLLLHRDELEVGTRLLAAASAAWLQLGARAVHNAQLQAEADERIQNALSDERLRVVLASGASMSHEAIIALVRAQLGTATTTAQSSATPPLLIRALGTLEVIRDGAQVDVSSLSLRARELLLFLLCNRGATKEQIGGALWPDADASRLRNNFHVTLHRLRKVLGEGDWISVQGDTYSVARDVAFDVDTFQRDVRAKRFEQAIAAWRGDFFANSMAGEWADDVRDRLKNEYAGALAALARQKTEAGDLRAATDAYEKLFAVDALDEDACRGLMIVLAKQGDTTGATRAYRRLSDSLRRLLDTQPDPATARLHAQILNGQL